jgi:hypothetical protein
VRGCARGDLTEAFHRSRDGQIRAQGFPHGLLA